MHSSYKSAQILRYACFLIFSTVFTQADAQIEVPGRLIEKKAALPDTSNLKIIKIDQLPVTPELTSSIMDSIVYLPLETTLESKLNKITRIEVTDKYYIIWDESANEILIFLKNGKYLKKISNKDRGLIIPYEHIGGFTVNEQKKQIIVNDTHSKYVYYYTIEGDFVRYAEKTNDWGDLHSSGDIEIRAFSYSRNSQSPRGLKLNQLTVTKGNQKSKGYFGFDTDVIDNADVYSVDQVFYDNHKGMINFSFTYDNNIYSVDHSAKLFNNFRFVLPEKHRFPADFLTNSMYKNKRVKYTDLHPDLLYSITDFYKVGDNITFRLFGYDNNITSIYNLKSGKIASLSDLISDKTGYMLPMFDKKIYALNSDGSLISVVDASTLLFASEASTQQDKHWADALPAALKTFFAGNFQQNPVLTLMYLKREI